MAFESIFSCRAASTFRLYLLIAALSQFHLTNFHTLSSLLARDLSDADGSTAVAVVAAEKMHASMTRNS